ncbi:MULTISPECIES: PP2C family serine/threonine-protein phosphatase [unclassified Roseateles]|uniref:PP2C family protein-serine/threonine phosphatase n=1 Tax=unclassified Roseateles TaxID=2626991 RepID=UPI0006F37B5B|nr:MULTISPECIES: PP2C family serine/threonine-protein phosphatase [unclassified Roseateles]KQW50787.1 serine/threonine protein phosphatase [Pelomonas sp. Root405]KRA70854.1 serine/threonine protein phosphatase [Pelomonas sp. Root662]
MRFSVFQVSRRGGRETNEDRMGYCFTREAGLFALADGMGGHPEGEVAAQIALQTLAALFQQDARPVIDDPQRFLQESIVIAHEQLLRYAQSKGLNDTPRTTVVVCILQGNQAWWAHCGDSRLYLVRGGKLIARTRDHSYSELQEALGRVARNGEHFNRNVLFTCLGSPGKPMVDCQGPLVMEPSDRLLLCSDGLWGSVDDAQIVEHLSDQPISEAAPELVEQALRRGGARSDNVTVLAVEWEGEGDPSGDTTQNLGNSGFASTIQGALDADLLAGMAGMDDEEIERSVREINEVIRGRGANRR